MKTIRGAITLDFNSAEDIRKNTIILLTEILNRNLINFEDVESIIFTSTKDITKAYPAKYAREMGFINSTLMCVQEMDVENSLTMCIRTLVFVNKEINNSPIHVYLKEAIKLRPDLIEGGQVNDNSN